MFSTPFVHRTSRAPAWLAPTAAVWLILLAPLSGRAVELDNVGFTITFNSAAGQSAYVLGNIPELGGNDPTRAIKLQAKNWPSWQATVAIPKGTSFTYQYIWREDAVVKWSNPLNVHPIGTAISAGTGPLVRRPKRKGLHYLSRWTAPVLNWRMYSTDGFSAVPLTRFGPGRSAGEAGWRAWGLGKAGGVIEFYFSDATGGRDPQTGTYATRLDAIWLQDGQIFDEVPPATVSPASKIIVPNFPSKILELDRPYRVWLPRGYAESTKRYPVLYMHDGQVMFYSGSGGTWQADLTADALVRAGRIREVILVAVDVGSTRTRDYVPPDDEIPPGLGGPAPGQADKYAAFLIQELKPVIDATYRTLPGPENTGVIGSSLGGLVSLYLAWDFNHVFGRCAAMSGSWQFTAFTTRLQLEAARPLHTYLDSGDTGTLEDNAWPAMRLRDVLMQKGYVLSRNLFHTVGYGHQHNVTAWGARLPDALTSLFPATDAGNPLIDELFKGDLDGDADIDDQDFSLMRQCLSGSDKGALTGCPSEVDADLDHDGDVDMSDFGMLQAAFTGPIP